jgi:hypothetical protein
VEVLETATNITEITTNGREQEAIEEGKSRINGVLKK